MKKTLTLLWLMAVAAMAHAGISEYEFTGVRWQSRQGTTVCDSTTTGWKCNKAGLAISTSYQLGVQVTSKAPYTGAGATSALTFHQVRRISFNYATTTKGAGSIRVQVGDNEPIDSVITNGTTNHDIDIILPEEQTGKVTFWVNCTTNSIYLHSIAIRSSDGVSPELTETQYQLVSNVNQLQDSDQVIFGIADGQTNKMMGYFDETISQNNIHAINATYGAERYTIKPSDLAIYTLRAVEYQGKTMWIIQDELRYEEAYLVASGGKTKNRLALWDKYTSDAYGDYGIWDITVTDQGEATICSQGTSLGRYIQYNAGMQLFGCYQEPNQMTPVAIYRAVPGHAPDEPTIVAPMVNFGDQVLSGESISGSKQIRVNAMKLTEDIQVSLLHGDVFSLSQQVLDRDGDKLTINYIATAPGKYTDTLLLQSGETSLQVSVIMNVYAETSVSEAVQLPDYSMVYMQPLVVTKKWDKYIFVRDETGSMLIYDTTDDQGKPYGQGLSNGMVLEGVQGRMLNYYGVPELQPQHKWTVQAHSVECLPESDLERLDSADVCRYVLLDSAVLHDNMTLTYRGETYAWTDKFNIGNLGIEVPTIIEAVVSIDWDVLTLWIVSQSLYIENKLDEAHDSTGHLRPTKLLRDGHVLIYRADNSDEPCYTL